MTQKTAAAADMKATTGACLPPAATAAMAVAAMVPALAMVGVVAANVMTPAAVARQSIPTGCIGGSAIEKSGLPSLKSISRSWRLRHRGCVRLSPRCEAASPSGGHGPRAQL